MKKNLIQEIDETIKSGNIPVNLQRYFKKNYDALKESPLDDLESILLKIQKTLPEYPGNQTFVEIIKNIINLQPKS